jgi:hypothetical protein
MNALASINSKLQVLLLLLLVLVLDGRFFSQQENAGIFE